MNQRPRRVGRDAVLVLVLLAILFGLAAAFSGFRLDMMLSLPLIGLIVVLRRSPGLQLVFILGLVFVLGVWRGGVVADELGRYEPLLDKEVVLVGRVSDDPSLADRGQTEFHIGDVRHQGESLRGRIRVRTYQAIGIQRGDKVQVSGKLYSGFGNRQGSVSFASVESLSRTGNPVESIRREYFSGVYSSIPDPEASLGLGFLVGLRALLPDELLNQLSITGLTHIVAVSGYNLTVLIRLCRRFFMRVSRFVALASSLTLMALFLLVTGGAPSIIRACVVAILSLLSWYFGRKIHPLVILLLSAAITAFVNPLYLWLDLGWWLSFLAFFGVLIIAPAVEARIFRRKLGLVGQLSLETSSAQLAVLPLIAAVFGELSLIALPANILVLPLIPLAMLVTFIAGTAGTLAPHIAGWFAWPATQVLSYMVDIIRQLSKVDGALVFVELNWPTMLIMYGCLLLMTASLYRRVKPDRELVE